VLHVRLRLLLQPHQPLHTAHAHHICRGLPSATRGSSAILCKPGAHSGRLTKLLGDPMHTLMPACASGQALVFRSDSREVETFVELIARNCIKGQLPPSVPLDRLRALSSEAAPDQRRLFDLMYTR
jgi:hypothetical protein